MDEVIRVLHRIERNSERAIIYQQAQLTALIDILKEIINMSTVPSGLAALTQANNDLAAAVSGLTTAVSAAVANIATLNSELANSEDPAVQAIAANISTQIAKISDATAGLNAADAPPVVQPPADNPPATT